jgi:hypothetical protein
LFKKPGAAGFQTARNSSQEVRVSPMDTNEISKRQKPFSKQSKLTARLVGNMDGKQVDLQEFMSKVPPGRKWKVFDPSLGAPNTSP